MKQKVVMGADHAGFKLKEHLKKFLTTKNYQVIDKGAKTYQPNDDYPDYAKKVTNEIKQNTKGILICGSAEGICIAANKKKRIRAVPVWTLINAKLSRQHNDANVLCLSGWQLNKKKAEKIVLTWLTTNFNNEPRHVRRIKKIEK